MMKSDLYIGQSFRAADLDHDGKISMKEWEEVSTYRSGLVKNS